MKQLNLFKNLQAHKNTKKLTTLRIAGKFKKGNPAPLYDLLANCKIEFASERWPLKQRQKNGTN